MKQMPIALVAIMAMVPAPSPAVNWTKKNLPGTAIQKIL
jgi:hypothetical protein